MQIQKAGHVHTSEYDSPGRDASSDTSDRNCADVATDGSVAVIIMAGSGSSGASDSRMVDVDAFDWARSGLRNMPVVSMVFPLRAACAIINNH
jgi:hypothetical protein